jgi:hypothetical protein
MMKKIRYILSALAAITGLAVLAACAQIVTPSDYLAGGTTGRVILSVSTGAENAARTILPTGTPVFSRYELDFTNGDTTISAPDTSGITGAGVSQELTAGTWTVTVRAYRNFTPTNGTETEYLAARGSVSITVTGWQVLPVTVPLTPVPVTDTTVKGIFTYKVTFPDGVTAAYLTIGSGEPVALTSGQAVSVEQDPGYYDFFITLRKGPLSAGTAEKVHIYSGLESQAEFTFEDVDFVQPVPLSYNTWAEGNLTADGQVNWYTFSATAGETYSLQFDSLGGPGNHTGAVYVTAYQGSAGYVLDSSSEYSYPLSINIGTDDTIYVSVQPNGLPGTYAVRYYDPSTEPPIAPSYVQMWIPQPDYTISWNPVGGATGYKVSRSTTETGSYTDIGSTVSDDGSYFYIFTDTGTSSGTYWYKVRAVNGHGEGPDSAAAKVSAPTLLPNDKAWTEGTLATPEQVDWYSFPVTAGITYSLQWDNYYDGAGKYTGEVYVGAYQGSTGYSLGGRFAGYSSPLVLRVDTNDIIYVNVQPYGPLGTYALRYYDSSTEPPAAPSYVQMWAPDYTIRWNPVGGATGYIVSRSTTETGAYSQQGTTTGEYSASFTDTGASSGTYWYKVRAVNGHGEGPDSAAVEVSASTPLSNDKAWTLGNLTAYGQVDWYSFPVTAGITYNLQWDNYYDGTGKYTGAVYVEAYSGDGSFLNSGPADGYSSPLALNVGTNDTIYVRVSDNGRLGAYALRYYDPSTEPPIAPSYVRMGIPQPDYTISWNPVGGATGYIVSRSTTETGAYSQQGTTTGEYSVSFTDTGTSSGTYWYKVRAVNGHGEGPDSAAAKVSAPTSLPNDKAWAEGNLTVNGQVDWYSLPATAGITYLQWDSYYDGTGKYTGAVYIEAYRSDGDYLAWGANGYSSPLALHVDINDTIYVRVQDNGPLGTYALRYYDPSTEPPAAPSYVEMWAPDYTIRWNLVGGATGYIVSRSTTEAGAYSQQGTTIGEYSASFTDTGASSGTYWYKVRAVNGHGEGPDSAAVEVSASTLLSNDKAWAVGNLTVNGQVDWYSFPVTAGITYNLQWDNYYDGAGKYTGAMYVEAYSSDGSYLAWGSSGYSSPLTLYVDTNDTIYVRVSDDGRLGAYALRYYDPLTEPPVAPSFVRMWIPQPDYTISWNSVGGATGYIVSRSATETGAYSQQGTTTGEHSVFFTDAGASSGTYWYKVRAVNEHGEGPDSAAVKVSAPTSLPNDKAWAEGKLATPEQVDWYSFPVTAGITYNLQWDNYYDGTGKYTGAVHVQAYRSDGSLLVGNSTGYSSPPTLNVSTNDTIYVVVLPEGPRGTYAIRYSIVADGPGQGGGGDRPDPDPAPGTI